MRRRLLSFKQLEPFSMGRHAASVLISMGAAIGCSRFDLLNATVPKRTYVATRDVAYGQQPRQKLDIFQPKNAGKPAAVVIFFYGGDWRSGSKADYLFVAEALASRGFVAVLPDYRLYPETTFPGFVQDGAAAIRWTHDHIDEFGGDPQRLFLLGHSAGGHIAALLTLDETYLQEVGLDRSVIRATTTLAGPFAFAPREGDVPVFAMRSADEPAPFASMPVNVVDGKAPPMQILHGATDTIVDPANVQRLSDRINAVGGAVRTAIYPGKGHVSIVLSLAWSFRWLTPALNDLTNFFREIDARPAVGSLHSPLRHQDTKAQRGE
ncbi:MAG TPA: alpha/beta hydrolase [Tepidisphaeraceae bacterium]|jgi:acetyl esterase/lipase